MGVVGFRVKVATTCLHYPELWDNRGGGGGGGVLILIEGALCDVGLWGLGLLRHVLA